MDKREEVRALVHEVRAMSQRFRDVVTRFGVILAEVRGHRAEHEHRQHPERLRPRTWTH